jgi:tetratricopeptide (TPR) repeat protein
MKQNASRLPALLHDYHLYLIDGESASFIKAVAGKYSIASLHRLAEQGNAITRRASVLAIGMLGDRSSVEIIGKLLGDSDRRVRMVADDSFKSLWYRSLELRGRNLLERTLTSIEANRNELALQLADQFVVDYPKFPEGYCRRALAHFNLGQIAAAIEDCNACLSLSSYHYMAYIGLGQCRLALDEPQAALDAFRRALSIYPDLETVRLQVRRLERMLRERT